MTGDRDERDIQKLFDLIGEEQSRSIRIEAKLDILNAHCQTGFPRCAERLARLEGIETDVRKIEDGQTWLWRILTGSIITAIVGAFIKFIAWPGVKP